MDAKEAARARIDARRDDLLDLSHRIHAHPETAFKEERSSAWVADALAAAGFEVERGVAGLPTALRASAGPGPLTVAVCAEYDALPGVGHACGHNVIAASAVGAGIGLAEVAADLGLRVLVMGTPAEEDGGGKIVLLRAGAFDGAHAAMMMHPSPYESPAMPVIAITQFGVRFRGKAAHASAYPELGINAADAQVVAQVAIGLLRQHLRKSDRVHGIVTKGGDAANIVPEDTAATYMVRATTLDELAEVRARVMRCFEAGALATGATLVIDDDRVPYSEMRHDPDLVELYRRNAEAVGRVFPGPEDLPERGPGSTDMGNVSLAMPSIHPTMAIESDGAVNHQPEFAAACATASADRAVIDGAVAMAWTTIDAATEGALRERLLASGGYRATPEV